MKKLSLFSMFVMLVLTFALASTAAADKPTKVDSNGVEIDWSSSGCTTIQSGDLYSSDGDQLTTGFDQFGYNYQAHMFNGTYDGADRNLDGTYWGGTGDYVDDSLIMKWNDAWLANVDCDGDGRLDRPSDNGGTYIGSGAWQTQHVVGDYELDGQTCNYEYFAKFVAVPADATLEDGMWLNADGTEIGPEIWGAFAITQEVYNDPCAGAGGIYYLSPDHAGLGGW